MSKATKVSLPKGSKIETLSLKAYFYDAWSVQAALPDLNPLEQFIRLSQMTPKWIDSMMLLRNKVVGFFGLKNLGSFTDIDSLKANTEYKLGDRVGIFTLIEQSENEVLLGDDDKHLSVVVSVYMEREADQAIVTISTVVHIKNWLGRLYMLPVSPAHHVIAQRMTQMIGETD